VAVDPDEADGAGPDPAGTGAAGGGTRRVPLEQVGSDPDYRFTLANERTFLAWIRTSLALVAAGVALVQFGPALGPRPIRLALGIGLILLSAALAAASHSRWAANERAMRLARPLPRNRTTAVLGYGLTIVALVMLVVVVVGG
jgi:putative membrane protein